MMNLRMLASHCDQLRWRQADGDVTIVDIVIDSRAVTPGCLFVALRGAAVDGHNYLDAAIEAGASAVLIAQDFEREQWPDDLAVLRTPTPRAILGRLAAAFFGEPSRQMCVIGVTGTNGKTTTSYILERLLQQAGRQTGVVGTVNYRWANQVHPAPNTTPESLALHRLMRQMANDGVDTVILEVSSHGLQTHRVVGVHFDVAIFTNLTQDHLDFHGTMEAYYQAKASFFTQVLKQSEKTTRTMIVNADDPWSARLIDDIRQSWGEDLESQGARLWQTSTEHNGVPWSVTAFEDTITHSALSVTTPTQEVIQFHSPMLGRFNASNTLQSVAASVAIDVPLVALEGSLYQWAGVPGRLERVGQGGTPDAQYPAVFVDYAHTPDALERALETLKPLTQGKLWVIFGAGGDRDRAKRPLMGQVAIDGADEVIVTSDNPRTEDPEQIIEDITSSIAVRWKHPDRAHAIARTIAWANPTDVILIAGKGHETYQEVGKIRSPFDDREHAMAAQNQSLILASCELALFEQWTHGKWRGVETSTLKFDRLITDSRKAQPGDLFVALVGERFDAHDFVAQVAQSGASGVVVSRHLPGVQIPQLVVKDTLDALQGIGKMIWSRRATAKTVALTGSNGKTTTKEILRCLWRSFGPTHATGGNFNNHIGVPLTLADLSPSHEYAIVEMGANAPGDIGELIQIASSDIRIITSIGVAHIEGFGGIDGVRQTKREIFLDASPETWAIVPYEEREHLILPDYPGHVLTFGSSDNADVRVLDAQMDATGGAMRVVLQHDAHQHTFRLPLIGQHNATNFAAAFATLIAAGVSWQPDVLNAALSELHVPGGRWREQQTGPYLWIDDAYNANPSSVVASFDGFMQWRRAQSDDLPNVVILGEMLELGSDAKNWHNRVIRDISVEKDLSTIICIGTFAASMADEARACGHEQLHVHACEDVQDAAGVILAMEQAVIFLKASRGARLERVIEYVQDGLA